MPVEVRTYVAAGIQFGQIECARHSIVWAYNWDLKDENGNLVPDPTGACGECYKELASGAFVSCGEHGISEKSEAGGCKECEATLLALQGRGAPLAPQGPPAIPALSGARDGSGERPADADPPAPPDGSHAAGGDRGRPRSAAPALSGDGAPRTGTVEAGAAAPAPNAASPQAGPAPAQGRVVSARGEVKK